VAKDHFLDQNNLPKHIAIIMDGNGRWAKQKNKSRIFGHRNGVKAVRETVEYAAEIGINYLTLYAFSTENWQRPKKEVSGLMSLLVSTIRSETKTLMENNIKLSSIGNMNMLPEKCKKELHESIKLTSGNTKLNLILALSYSSRWEIKNAIRKIIGDGLKVNEISEDIIEQYLATKNVPDPELLIRTSGENRVSNFLLWQIAYTEFYF
jgi:undecaprenyl diphosphate synthase